MTAKRGRKSKYKLEYAEQAKTLCLWGWTDEQIAYFFGVDIGRLAHWAWDHEEFFNAITPTPGQRASYEAERQEDRDKINKAKRARLAASPPARVQNATSARMWAALRGRSDGKLFSRLNYTAEQLIEHIERRFEPGMSWKNYGKWHIDHIKPCVRFDQTNPAQFAECWALRNLQPLWASDNISKGSKYAGP